MDAATLIGIISGFALIIVAIITANEPLTTFQDAGSAMIVVGGTVAALFVSFPMKRVFGTLKVVRKALFADRTTPNKLIGDLVSYAEIARRDGILALENMTHEIQDEFIVRGIQMAVDGTDPELIEQIMVSELEALQERHRLGKQVFDTLAKYAPAFGMIGTLIGLVQMLGSLEDPSGIGVGMATALITTFYGALLANLVFIPLAGKLGTRSKHESLLREMIVEGVLGIVRGESPTAVREKMQAFVSARHRENFKPSI